MQNTRWQDIVDALMAQLGTIADFKFWLMRRRALGAQDAINVLPGGYEIDDEETGIDIIDWRFTFDCMVTAKTDAELSSAAGQLDAALTRAIATDPTLGGKVIDIQLQGISGDITPAADGDTPAAGFDFDIVVRYQRPKDEPFLP